MTDAGLDDDDLLELHEAALQENRAGIRATMDALLDEVGLADPARREHFHSEALRRAMPIVRAVCLEDIEDFRRGDTPAPQH